MAYYSGLCNSYQHLADILVEKCQVHGWTWQDGILNKDKLFIKIAVDDIRGIFLLGGMGKQGTTLINDSNNQVRLGSPLYYNAHNISFPAHFHLCIFDDEVYLIVKSNIDRFYYLAFGKSSLIDNSNTNGLWLSATAHSGDWGGSIEIYEYGGGLNRGSTGLAPFYSPSSFSNNYGNSVICHGIDSAIWSNPHSPAWANFQPLISVMPTNHFSDSPLLPYNIYLSRPENKLSLICQLKNARFVRIDHYEPEQILTLGHERWLIFPFFQKNVSQRGGGYQVTHSGTFGWAIRYEG